MTEQSSHAIIIGMDTEHTSDGSSIAQIKSFSQRVTQLTVHLKKNKKDHSSRHGLMRIISKRKRLLTYLQRTDIEAYKNLIEETGIRHSSR